MDESEENISAEDNQNVDSPISVKNKPKKRSLVERELETNLTARVTSPVTSERSSTSRYGRARRLKIAADMTVENMADVEKIMKPLKIDVSKQPQAYKMHASNSPISNESPKRTISVGSSIEDQIENIYSENIALSRFGSEEKAKLQSPAKKFSKVYVRKDLIQKPDTDSVILIKNMFSPTKPNSHLSNILERSSEKYALNGHGKPWNGFPDTSSVVKTLDFDGKQKKKGDEKKKVVSKNELFDIEASCEYQVGDLAWARVGTYPFWPCIVTREPFSDLFVKRKLFGRVERSVIHVTFFGDNGRRGWIVDNMLRKYHGRAEFMSSRDKFTPDAKKKDPRLYAAYFVSEKKLPLWNVSVDEAETLVKEPKRLRIDILYDMLEKARASKSTPKRDKGGKISRTDSDVSLSESLYDTLFSEDDGKIDDNSRSKRVRNKSLDVSEVVTACLDNMAAKSGIIQIQRQSHMDRWLQKAKSKTPEKMQPKLHMKVEREKRNDKVKKKTKDGKKLHKVKNESLGSDTNLLPYQNEHDYSSVNYENHDINDSSNKNTDSASGHDRTLNSSGIGVVVKIENLSSSMEDLSQNDIITTVVNDDILMTDPENINNNGGHNEINHNGDNNSIINDKMENNNEHSSHLDSNKPNENEKIQIKEEFLLNNGDLTNSVQPRRSKRKRQTEGLNNSITENKAKEPKLDLTEPEPNINNTLTAACKPKNDAFQVTAVEANKDCDSTKKTEVESDDPNISKREIESIQHCKSKSIELTTFNSNSKPVVVIEPLNLNSLEAQLIIKGSEHKLLQSKLLDSVFKNDKQTEDKLDTLDAVNVASDILKDTNETSQEVSAAEDSIENANTKPDSDITSRENSAPENSIENLNTKRDSDIDTLTGVGRTQARDDISKDHQHAEGLNYSGRLEVATCASQVMVEGEKNILDPDTKTNLDPTLSLETMTSVVPTEPSIQKNEEVLKNQATNVVIGEETYIFDRTLSQDYDEIDAGEYAEVSSLSASGNKEAEYTEVIQKGSNGLEKTSPQDCQDNKKTSDLKSPEDNDKSSDSVSPEEIVSSKVDGSVNELTSDVNITDVSEATSDLHHVSIFLDKRDKISISITEAIEDNKVSTVASDVSSVMNDEQNEVSNNQVTEENNAKCVFLDRSLVIRNAQSADSIEKKRKSPRFRLNRTRIITLNKVANNIQTSKTSQKKMNTEVDKSDIDTGLTDFSDSEISITRSTQRSKYKLDPKKGINDPEFIKYLEIRQDALLDEQPDLTQEEIETYLYQNWLYEEGNKSDMKKIDDTEQSNLVKGSNQEPVPQPKQIKKKPKVENAPETKNIDIRDMMHKEKLKSVSHKSKSPSNGIVKPNKQDLPNHCDASCEIVKITRESKDSQSISEIIINYTKDTKLPETSKTSTEDSNSLKKNYVACSTNIDIHTEPKSDADGKNTKTSGIEDPGQSENVMSAGNEPNNLKENGSEEPKVIGYIKTEEVSSKANDVFDPKIVCIKSEDCGVSVSTRKGRKEKQDTKKSMEDPEFLKYLEARQDALIDEQPDLSQEEIVTYLYQTWFYEESQKSDVKKSDDTEQSNLVKGLNQEPAPQPRKYKKKAIVEKETKVEKEIKLEKEPVVKLLKNVDIRDMVQKEKPKRKATQSKPYYNEEDSDLEEEDLETFKIFDRNEQEPGEEIDEVELYFEQLTKPKPNVFKGYVRERVCEICDRPWNLVKCKSCHGTFHADCVNKETEVIQVAAPTRGRKKKRGRKPKNYDPLLDSGSQSDERSQDANNSEELNISIEDEAESHIIIDADNFETLWENKLKELQTENQDDYASDQEIDWEVEPGHCEIVDLKHKEKPIDYSDYKCNNCLKYDTPVCFVCKSNKSPKAQTEVRQKCQVAHCHRYYHLECLDHWPQTQFNSWEPSKTNKKTIEYIEALSCPRHVCHTCVSDDPRGCKTRFCGDKLARCVKCPATYHSYTKCLPAGTQILTGSQIICPRHYEHRPGKVPCHVNTGWCFICALGGTLICCEYCPTSFHAECLNIKPPEGSYMCEDCETGRLPLYGEMVWVKLGHYRWWPGIVLHPTEIPDNILAVKHSPGEFVVRFFGQYDHYWVNRGRVFPFQEGDSGRISSQKSKIDAAFTTAMEHAQRACEILKKMEPNEEEDLDIASSLLPPHYVKLKVNKPVGSVVRRDIDANSLTQCDCDPTQPDPCGPYSHCLNRMLLTECGPQCRAGEGCHNRAFERRRYPRLQPYRTPHRGWGLRTLEDIKQGQFVIEYVGELIDMEEFRRRMCRKHEIRDENFYFLTLDKERMIDAGPKGNLARFMNHCCEPNCETQKWTVLGDVRVGLFALRDIPANSEVTFNYNLECAGIEKKRCLCGAKRCSGYIGAKPKQLQEDQPKKPKRAYKKRKPVEDPKPKPKIKIKPIKPRELTEIEKDLLIINSATNCMSSDSDNSRASVGGDDKNARALKRKRVSFCTDKGTKKAKIDDEEAV